MRAILLLHLSGPVFMFKIVIAFVVVIVSVIVHVIVACSAIRDVPYTPPATSTEYERTILFSYSDAERNTRMRIFPTNHTFHQVNEKGSSAAIKTQNKTDELHSLGWSCKRWRFYIYFSFGIPCTRVLTLQC